MTLLRALAHAAPREWRDHGRLVVGLVAGFLALSLAISSRPGPHHLAPIAVAAALVPPFAAAGLPSSVVDDAASGLLRLVGTQPTPRATYALFRLAGSVTLLLAVLVPPFLVLAFATGMPRQGLEALPILALSVTWSVAAALLVGLLGRGPGLANGAWILLGIVNALMLLRVWPTMDGSDVAAVFGAAMPGVSAAWAIDPSMERAGAMGVRLLALETLLAVGCLLAYASRAPRTAEPASWRMRAGVACALVAAAALPSAMGRLGEAFPWMVGA